MQMSLDESKIVPVRVKNILTRHGCSKKVKQLSNYQHPEAFYILKYAPKYYKSLTLQATCQSPLWSKAKKIKKLKKFTGYSHRYLPHQLWFNLLKNTRKEMQEIPEISSSKTRARPSAAFWEKLNRRKLSYFWNMTRVFLPKWRGSWGTNNRDNLLSSKKSFLKHVCYLRRLKRLGITVKWDSHENVKWVLAKLNGMDGLLKRLETLSLDLLFDWNDLQEIIQNSKRFFSHLTSLYLSVKFDPALVKVLMECKKLNSLAVNFHRGIENERPELKNFVKEIQQLHQLKYLKFAWPKGAEDFWSDFKPQPSLEYFHLKFEGSDMINAGLFEAENIVAHWEEIKQLKDLEFILSCDNAEEFNFMRIFVTKVLKKVQKVRALNIWITAPLETDKTYEPFFIEDVQHIYGTLKKLEYRLSNSWKEYELVKFDLKTLMLFKNLKSLKILGNIEPSENIGDIVGLLEDNQKEGEYPVLKLDLKQSFGSEWLRNTLEIIERTKRNDKNLKVRIHFTFGLEDYLRVLEEFCRGIQCIRTIKGLRIWLNFIDCANRDHFLVENIRELSERYHAIRNLNVMFLNDVEGVEWIKIDREKEQLLVYPY